MLLWESDLVKNIKHGGGGRTDRKKCVCVCVGLCKSAAPVVLFFFSVTLATGFDRTVGVLRPSEWTCVGNTLMKS